MDNQVDIKKYVDELVEKLMNDPDWELPAEDRKYLKMNLIWGLVFL